jgi:hypothetical protein
VLRTGTSHRARQRLPYVDDHGETARTILLDIVIGRVVRDMTVKEPLAGPLRSPDDVVALPGTDIERVREIAGCGRQCCTVTRHNLERN